MADTSGFAQKLPIQKFVGEYNAKRLRTRAEIDIHHSTPYDFDHLKRILTEHYPEHEPHLHDFLCDLGEAMALADLIDCDINGRGELVNRNDALRILNRDYIFVSDPNSKDDRITQTRRTAERYVTDFENESMKAAEDDHTIFGDDLEQNLPRDYRIQLTDMGRAFRQAFRIPYNGAFRGVSETFIGWDQFRDYLYTRRPLWRRKVILTTVRRLRVHSTYGAENGLLLPWVKRRLRKEHRRRAQIKLFTAKTAKLRAARSQPAATPSVIPQAVLSLPLDTQPSTSLTEISTSHTTSEADMAVEPTHADTENVGGETERSSHGLSPPESSGQPAGLLTPPQDSAPTSPLQASSPPQIEMSRWIHDMYLSVGFTVNGHDFVGWKMFRSRLLDMKPAVEHEQLRSELRRLRKPGHADSLPSPQEVAHARARARKQSRAAQHDPQRISAPPLLNPRADSPSISTLHAQPPDGIGSSTALSFSVMQTPTVPQPSNPDIPVSQPVGEAPVPSPTLVPAKSAPPAQPSAPQQSSSQPSETPSKGSLVAKSEAATSLSAISHSLPKVVTQANGSGDHPEPPTATENNSESRKAPFHFNFGQETSRENVFNFSKSNNAPLFVFGGTTPQFPDGNKRNDAKPADSTASRELKFRLGETSLQKLFDERNNIGKSTLPTNNAQPDPAGKSESTQDSIHAPSSSKTSQAETQQNFTAPIQREPAPTAPLYKPRSGKEPATGNTFVAGPSASVRTNGQSQHTAASTSASAPIPVRVNAPIQHTAASVSASRPSTSNPANGHSQAAVASTSAPTNSIQANGHSHYDTHSRATASVQSTTTSNPPDFNRFGLLLKKGRNGGKAKIIERDIRQGPLLSGEIVQKYSRNLVPQYGLVGSLAGEDVSSPSSQIFSNPSTPFSAFICGVQGSGKSHTTACLLENSMICSDNIGRLHGSVSSLVFAYGSSEGNNISEVAYLGASKPGFENHHAKKVTVLVSPSNKAIGKRYEELPNVRAIPFYLNAKTLTIHAMTMLMAFDEKAVKPMYMSIVESVLRDMATKSLSDNAPLNYLDFKSRLGNEGLDPKQKKTLDNRLKVLETFLDLNGKFPQPQYAPGEITIMDLSDNQLSSTTACILFKLGLENFLKSSATVKMVVLDEAHKYMGDTPGAKFFSEGLGRAIREMRHEGLRVIISTQEPTVANELIALCSVTIIHRFSSPTWYSALKKHINALDEEKDIMHQIEELSTGEALVYAPTAVLKENEDGSLVKATGQFLKIDVRDRVTEDGGESRLAA